MIKELKSKNVEERNLKESYLMKFKSIQDKFEKMELKAKTLDQKNEDQILKKKETSDTEECDKNEDLNKTKNQINKLNPSKEFSKFNYFSRSLHN